MYGKHCRLQVADVALLVADNGFYAIPNLQLYGDNREPGRNLHDTARDGNLLLRDSFEAAHGTAAGRSTVAPFFLFERTSPGWAVRFRGLLAPGAETLSADDDLNAIWRSKGGLRFQNYRAKFSLLDVPEVSRHWIDDLVAGVPPTESDSVPVPGASG